MTYPTRATHRLGHGVWRIIGIAWCVCWPWHAAQAGEVRVAVAANFVATFERLVTAFETQTGHKAITISGSTGKFRAQIMAGAPFDVLLAADADTPRQLEVEGLSVKGQRFTYALGTLVLWSTKPHWLDAHGDDVLRQGQFAHVAMANPELAPYGAAAMQTLQALGLQKALASKIVQGENIAQTKQFVATGNAALGFVALSQVLPQGHQSHEPAPGSWWVVPAGLHRPIQQDAVLLVKGEGNPAALALMGFLRSHEAHAIIRSHGYGF